jgi:hypothetical protein
MSAKFLRKTTYNPANPFSKLKLRGQTKKELKDKG